jgi:hypothetical protein
MSKTDTTAEALVTEYLARLRAEVASLGPGPANELVADIADHIAAARGELTDETAGDVRAILRRLGTPAEIAAAAGAETAPRAGLYEYLALATCVFGFFLPVVGSLAGLVLVSFSRCWTARQRGFAWALAFVPVLVLIGVYAATEGTLKPWHLLIGPLVMLPFGTVAAGVVLGVQLHRRSR